MAPLNWMTDSGPKNSFSNNFSALESRSLDANGPTKSGGGANLQDGKRMIWLRAVGYDCHDLLVTNTIDVYQR